MGYGNLAWKITGAMGLVLFITCVVFCLWLSRGVAELTTENATLRTEVRTQHIQIITLLESISRQQGSLANIIIDSREINTAMTSIKKYNFGRVEKYRGMRWTKPLGIGGGYDEKLVRLGDECKPESGSGLHHERRKDERKRRRR